MFAEFLTLLSRWDQIDTAIVWTGALAAMACALPGCFLVLRRQSMMGDAISHTVLPGIVIAFLVSQRLLAGGAISADAYEAARHASVYLGALGIGVLSALLTEGVQKLGRVESSAALGVVFTSLFALGLVLLRTSADSVDLDPDCVLYGTIETVVMKTVRPLAGVPGLSEWEIPQAAAFNAAALLVNGLLVLVFFKELRLAAFDPNLAAAQGIPAGAVHYALMAVTAATLVAAFESVGSILVIAMLIVPAATASLLTDRLWVMLVLSLVVAAVSALAGHAAALTLPPIIFGRLGFTDVRDASTAGMMALACGGCFLLALLLAPRHGLLSKAVGRTRLAVRIACEDVLGGLYRLEELQPASTGIGLRDLRQLLEFNPLVSRLAIFRLRRTGRINVDAGRCRLTATGRRRAQSLVRSHRLWESYMAKHFQVPADHLHATAARVEHYLGPELRADLSAELDRPDEDPHGRVIPSERGDGGNAEREMPKAD
jgi:manganese/zinc/iron transport system permease protein